MLWLDSWTCRQQTACVCFLWPKKSTGSSLLSRRGYLLFSLVYWKELPQQLLLLQTFIPKAELRDQDTSRKLLYPLAGALLAKTTLRVFLLDLQVPSAPRSKKNMLQGSQGPSHPSVYLPIHTWILMSSLPWCLLRVLQTQPFWTKKYRGSDQESGVSKLIFYTS